MSELDPNIDTSLVTFAEETLSLNLHWWQAAVLAWFDDGVPARVRLPRSPFCKSSDRTKVTKFSARIRIAAEHRFEAA